MNIVVGMNSKLPCLSNLNFKNSEQVARDKLYNLKQLTSVFKYNEKFNHLLMQIPDMGEKDTFDKHKRGLHVDLQFEGKLKL